MYRSRSALLKREMAAAGLSIEAACDISGVNGPASGASIDAAIRALKINAPGSGVRTNTRSDARKFQTSRACIGFDGPGKVRNRLASRAGGRSQLRVLRHC